MTKPSLGKTDKKRLNAVGFIVLLSIFIAIVTFHFILIASASECKEGLAGLFCFKMILAGFISPILTLVAGFAAISLIAQIIKSLKTRSDKHTSTINIQWSKTMQSQVPKRFLSFLLLGLIVLATLTPIAITTNTLAYSLNTIRCGGLPIESFDVIGSSHYRLPSDDGYGIKSTSSYTLCSQDEAEATLGYHITEPTKALAEKGQKYLEDSQEKARFSPEKVTYQLYVPNPEVYTIEDLKISEIQQVNHSFYYVRKDGVRIGEVRQVPIDNAYNLCDHDNNPSKRYCKRIGSSLNGIEIYREYNNGLRGVTSQYAGANIGNTGIIVRSDIDQNVIDLINALVPYRD